MAKITKEQQIEFGLLGVRSSKYRGIKEDKKRNHKEADLHLQFCKWIKKEYPNLKFVRHEKEAKRGKAMQNMVKVYNTDSGLPDFELLEYSDLFHGLYIEFKRPGEQWQTNGIVKDAYAHQYIMHKHLWSIGRCVYFCNEFEDAKIILMEYLKGSPLPQQQYKFSPAKAFEYEPF